MKRKLTVPSVSRLYTGSPHTSMPYATRFEAPGIPGLFFIWRVQTGFALRQTGPRYTPRAQFVIDIPLSGFGSEEHGLPHRCHDRLR